MDRAVAGAVSHFRDAAGRQVTVAGATEMAVSPKARTALILAAVALVFFIGVVVRHWLW